MIGVHPGGHIGIQRMAGQPRRMAVDFLVMGLGHHDLLDGGALAMDHPGVVHHFRQP